MALHECMQEEMMTASSGAVAGIADGEEAPAKKKKKKTPMVRRKFADFTKERV